MKYTLVKKTLPQKPDVEVMVPGYKDPILPVTNGYGWYGLQSYEVLYDEGGNPYPGKLLCHECGEFWADLSRHILKHKLSGNDYREKYGLLRQSKLQTDAMSEIKRLAWQKRSDKCKEEIRARFQNIRHLTTRGRDKRKRLEFKNTRDTCPTQILRWLNDAAQIYGKDITISEAEQFRPGLRNLLTREYGTFNKAKQLVNLNTNQSGNDGTGRWGNHKYNKVMVLEDIIHYIRLYNRLPTQRDYKSGKMICSDNVVQRNGGLRKLCQEAMKLKEEQDKRPNQKDVAKAVNQIEMEYAGRARK